MRIERPTSPAETIIVPISLARLSMKIEIVFLTDTNWVVCAVDVTVVF